ncbi:general stress protein [Paenibacillus lemnae]|uniref:General stress protein n=1 Tax=Paenibacillus lemnae TaxID=1330551 RepID=A0A848MAJ6_PAELE|nr:general stress protein [Paenibacillus lemnae]NMO97279.1 general stress protein [Paenibacillus lemnae]
MESANPKAYAKITENATQAVQEVQQLQSTGYMADQIFVLAHDSDKSERIAHASHAKEVGMKEEGVFDSIANLFRSRGDELRAKIVSLGFTEAEADFYEKQLDLGKVLVIAKKNQP